MALRHPIGIIGLTCVISIASFAQAATNLEDFESGNIANYTFAPAGFAAATAGPSPDRSVARDRGSRRVLFGGPAVTAAAAHDGLFGLEMGVGGDDTWIFRDDAQVHVQQGDLISYWVRLTPSTERCYNGFGASAAGTYSVALAPNTGSLVMQRNLGYGFQELAQVPQSWQPQWYRLEVDWGIGGFLTARLYDSDGITLLNTVSAFDNTMASGGLAFRAFNSFVPQPSGNFDTITSGRNTPPVCDAGGPYGPACQGAHTSVQLIGTGSSDADGDSLEYAWTSSCPGATFDNPASPKPVLTVNTPSGNVVSCSVTLIVRDGNGGQSTCTAPITIDCRNQPPDCRGAAPTLSELWPPNHRMTAVGITGVTDADGDQVSVLVTGITQDEPLTGLGSGDTTPDGAGVGTPVAQLRAERAGTGNGRVYVISFTASDGRGGACAGQVAVCVPHDRAPHHDCVDDGQSVNSLGGGGPAPSPAARLRVLPARRFNPVTTLEYNLTEPTEVHLGIFDVAGRKVATLVQGRQESGVHAVIWDSSSVPNGVYYARVHAGDWVETKRLVVIR